MCALFCAGPLDIVSCCQGWDPLLLLIVSMLKDVPPRHQAHVALIYRPGPYFSFFLSLFSPPNNFENFGAHLKGRSTSISFGGCGGGRHRHRRRRGERENSKGSISAAMMGPFCLLCNRTLGAEEEEEARPTNELGNGMIFFSFFLSPFLFLFSTNVHSVLLHPSHP